MRKNWQMRLDSHPAATRKLSVMSRWRSFLAGGGQVCPARRAVEKHRSKRFGGHGQGSWA